MSSPLVHDGGCPSITGTQQACHRWGSACHARVHPGPRGVAPLQWASLRAMRSRAASSAGQEAAGPRGHLDRDAAACGAARHRGGYTLFPANAMRIYVVLTRQVAGRGVG